VRAAHEPFPSDSRHLPARRPSPEHLGRKETAVLLASAVMRGAGLDRSRISCEENGKRLCVPATP
jgi:protein-L-isoaspartate(D-aspartate) O-methyltransferase